jgi:hypothetical protein
VEALLCVGEAPLKEPIKGMGTFLREYEAGGIRDKKGRSLRELDLKNRLYKYRLSPMIHSASFAGLPVPARKQTIERLQAILGGEDRTTKFSFLSDRERADLMEMLGEFKLLP